MKWTFNYSSAIENLSYEVLAEQIMPDFGLRNNEIKVYKDRVEGSPTPFIITRMITPVRLAVYDIILKKNTERKEISIKIRFYTLFIFPLLPVLFASFLGIPWYFLVLFYLISIVFFGASALFQLYLIKSSIKKQFNKRNKKSN